VSVMIVTPGKIMTRSIDRSVPFRTYRAADRGSAARYGYRP
jgi:hypothetical protein